MKRMIPLLFCTACVAVETVPAPEEDTCGAATYAALIGQDVTALEKVLIMRMVQVIRPGDMVTLDYRPGRVNFMIGEDQSITAVTCG